MSKIKDAIAKRGMTIKAVAENMGIIPEAFHHLLHHEDELEDETLQRIADAIGCDISEVKKSNRGGWRGGGRPVTVYKVPVMVRISQEAADLLADVKNRSEYIDTLIKRDHGIK